MSNQEYKKPFTCLHRLIISSTDLTILRSHCMATEDIVIVPGERLLRHIFRGVPAAQVDLCLPTVDAIDRGHGPLALVLEIGVKVGKWDGHNRIRLTVRHWAFLSKDRQPTDHQGLIPIGRIIVDRREITSADVASLSAVCAGGDHDAQNMLSDALQEAGASLTVAALWRDGAWHGSWTPLPSDLSNYDLPRIVLWHWTRYYQFLPREDAELIAASFEAQHPEIRQLDLNAANRLASRDLYRLARELGWRKLTLREATKYQLSSGWQRQENIERRRQEMGYSPTGTGRYTREAASGNVPIRSVVE